MTNYFIENKKTGKLELHFEKETYTALTEEQKKTIKSSFLWSRSTGAWVSRCKFPNLYFAKQTAEKIGLTDAGSTGERLTFEEQQERKQGKAEARAEKYDFKATQAKKRGKELQAPIDSMRGDIAFFTQPNINTSAGRAFTRRRERMYESYKKGFEEFKKSEYYIERAEAARQTAEKTKDKGFCQRRIDEATKTVKAQTKNIDSYNATLEKINNGETVKNWEGEILTAEQVEKWIENAEDIREEAIGKIAYYTAIIDDLGGIIGKSDLKPGDLVKIYKWTEPVKFIKGGTKNFTYEFLVPHMVYADGSPMEGKATYAEIEKII